ncbi:MAG: DNA mismatch repair endonuclease MutL [Candidatus Gastranaerophilales bacterium]|nr:DNA mismatch repair endonuclease MutL [Candidatus Gastranaerophilales bacterium]
MKRIKQLSKHLINQIAAGEVIERPASVVKEIVENSIDAGATKISIEVTNECRDLRIADNGSGIHPDDIMLAFSKHATSKIETDEDLFTISTLGFRGEALSSIISIAKLTCTTRTKDFDYGTKVECENSQVKKVQTGCAVGTIMEVKNLFYNLPARLKFLKNPKTEFSYIQELVQSLAIINPQISFELKNNGKTVLKTTGLGDLKQTIQEVYSQDVVNNLKEVLKTDKFSGFRIAGFVSTPDYTRSSKKSYHIYVNSRMVASPVLQKSIDTAYKNLIGSGKYPFVVLNLELPPTEVDVNVHPTKKEVRYKNTNQIYQFVYSAVDIALSNNTFAQNNEAKTAGIAVLPKIETEEDDDVYVSDVELEQKKIFFEDIRCEDAKLPSLEIKDFGPSARDGHYASMHPVIYASKDISSHLSPNENILGQYKNTYILIEREEGLEIVDQHIAEERFIYEKLKSQKQPASQMLFISDVLEVSAVEAERLKENKEKFEKFGYGIEFLKENRLIFKKIPQMLAKVSPKELLGDIL